MISKFHWICKIVDLVSYEKDRQGRQKKNPRCTILGKVPLQSLLQIKCNNGYSVHCYATRHCQKQNNFQCLKIIPLWRIYVTGNKKKAYLILHVNCPIVITFGFSQQIFIKVRTDGRTDLWTYRQEDGRTDMATLIALILDYKKAPKTGFIERTVLICDAELAFSATFNTTGPTKTCRLLLT